MITILMAVYNGEKFLSRQIESVISQTYTEWKLIICDDCSTDSSYNIAMKYNKLYPHKMAVYKNKTPAGSAQANFMNMLKYSDSEYTMFADQDDVWLPDKISLTLAEMKRIELNAENIPVLVHTDMSVVDAELKKLSPSFMKYCHFNPNKRDLNHLIVQNNISGCTMMINRQLLKLVEGTLPSDMMMHDWWFGLAAAAFGKIGYVDKPTSLYRQHGNNQLGATRKNSAYYTNKLKNIIHRNTSSDAVTPTIQARNFLRCYNEQLSGKERKIVAVYSEFSNMNFFQRWYCLFKYRLWKQNLEGVLGQVLMIYN